MLIEIDFNSEEAIYIQLRNQVILGIATANIHEGDSLPSVRQLAETIGVVISFYIMRYFSKVELLVLIRILKSFCRYVLISLWN